MYNIVLSTSVAKYPVNQTQINTYNVITAIQFSDIKDIYR